MRNLVGGIFVAVIAIVGVFGTLYFAGEINNVTTQFSGASSYDPSPSEIKERCIDKIRELQGSEATQFQVNLCVGTVLQGLNK